MQGRYCTLEPIDPDKHAAALFESNRLDTHGRMWTYLSYGPWETLEAYREWMKSAYWISTTLCPAISVPAGFTADGLPVGVQIVGRRGDDLGVLQLAHAFEIRTGFSRRRPSVSIKVGS